VAPTRRVTQNLKLGFQREPLPQIYTALVFSGPARIPRIVRELARLLRADGFGSIVEAVGAANRSGAPPPPARRAMAPA
jgi:hypothetical protein